MEAGGMKSIHPQKTTLPAFSAGRLRDQDTRHATCLLAPSAGSLKGSHGAFFPSQSFLYLS